MLKSKIENEAETLKYIKDRIDIRPDVMIILGSGFGCISENTGTTTKLPYASIPFFQKTTAPTHCGNLVFGEISGKNLMLMEGRLHVYEGYSAFQTAYPVQIAAALGVKTLITTNLSGGIREDIMIGDFMVVEDHLNLSGLNPLRWNVHNSSGQFTDMYAAYAPELIRTIQNISSGLQISLQKGVLAYLTGPNFETRAELRMLRTLGADAVGWSMIPEVLVARRYGLDILGITCISDLSNPEKLAPVNLEQLYEVGINKAAPLFSLLEAFLKRL